MLRVLWRILAAPFFYVGFADFWVADQLNSLANVFADFHYVICFYANVEQVCHRKIGKLCHLLLLGNC